MLVEEWRPIPSIAGAMASSLGHVILPEATRIMPNGGIRIYRTRPLLGWPRQIGNYASRKITHRTFGTLIVARLICEAFHGAPPFNEAQAMHLDENPHNNRANNLRWGTIKENMNAPKYRAMQSAKRGEHSNWAVHRSRMKSGSDKQGEYLC